MNPSTRGDSVVDVGVAVRAGLRTPGRHAAILAEALHACARAASRDGIFACLDALAAGPLAAVGLTVFIDGPDQRPRVVHSSGAASNRLGAAPSPVFSQLVAAAMATRSPMTLRALDTLPGAHDDARLRALLEGGVQAVAVIPFGTARTRPGILSLRYATDDALDEAEIDILRDVALLAALALERVDAEVRVAPATLSAQELRQRHLAIMGELIPAVIHDLNNPLTGISAFAELLEAEIAVPDQLESVGYIRREAQQAARLLRDLQALARPTSPDTLVDLNALVESALRLRGYLLRGAGATVRVSLAPGLPPVQGDQQALLQILMHLLARAESVVRLSSPSARTVEVATLREPQVAMLRIVDTGPGMSPAALGRMFDATAPASSDSPVPGMGLSIAKALVEALGGTISAGGGLEAPTSIEVRLPIPPIVDPRSPSSR